MSGWFENWLERRFDRSVDKMVERAEEAAEKLNQEMVTVSRIEQLISELIEGCDVWIWIAMKGTTLCCLEKKKE